MPYDFNAYKTPTTATSTAVTFAATSGTVRFNGTNLSYNVNNANLTGTITSIDIINASGQIVQTQTPKLWAALPFATFTQHGIMESNKIEGWFGNKVDHTNTSGIVFGGTTLSIPIYDSTNVLLGYVKAAGTGLTSAGWAAGTGVITSMWHADTAGVEVTGANQKYFYATGATSAHLSYGLLRATDGSYGTPSLIDIPLSKGSDTYTATSATTTINGGIGDDTYDVAGFTITIIDAAGIDTIKSTASRSIASASFLENITLTGTGVADATGNAGKNVLIGNSAANTLSGAAGDDTLTGNDGVDTLYGGDNNDKLDGGLGNDTLRGDAGNDLLTGGDGLDNFYGGLGKDTMTGGAGADKFYFTTSTDSSGSGRDTIKDFVHLTDKIDLSGVDANTKLAGNQVFTFKGTAAFSGVAGQLHYKVFDAVGTANDKTVIEGDLDGNKVADFYIDLTGLKGLTAADFVL